MERPLPSLAPVLTALEERAILDEDISLDAMRVFHGRGKCYEGLDWLNIDYFSPLILVTVFKSSEIDVSDTLVEHLQEVLIQYFQNAESKNINAVLIQRRDLDGAPVSAIVGTVPDEAFATRGDLKFGLSFSQQNTGFFLDIEPARRWLETRCQGKNVLNLFSYTCAFSVVAKAAGALSVVNIDLSKKSLQRGQRNHHRSQVESNNVTFLSHDIFKSWGKLKKYSPYDIVVIDPPSFQKGSFVASKDYEKVIRKMDTLLSEDGVFLACLNAPEVRNDNFKAMIEGCAEGFMFVERLEPLSSFPERDAGRELKMLVFQRERSLKEMA